MKTGGQGGIRDEGLLESTLAAPLQTFYSVDLYPSIVDKLARLSFRLVMNHPFFDGNKRIGAYALTVGLKLNGIPFPSMTTRRYGSFLDLPPGKSATTPSKIGFALRLAKKAIGLLFVWLGLECDKAYEIVGYRWEETTCRAREK